MDQEMQGILDRADELTRDLAQEYEACAQRGEVSERAKNLFHEVTIKIRSALDFAMNRIFDKHTNLKDNDKDKKKDKKKIKRRVYFPIFKDRKQFNKKLEEYGLSDLEQSKPDLYTKILEPQPFSSKRDDLMWLKELSNLGKHVQLALQDCQVKRGKRIAKPDGSIAMFTEGVKFYQGGKEVDPSIYGDVQDINWATFNVDHNSGVYMPDLYCRMLCQDTRRYMEELLALIE